MLPLCGFGSFKRVGEASTSTATRFLPNMLSLIAILNPLMNTAWFGIAFQSPKGPTRQCNARVVSQVHAAEMLPCLA